MQKTEICKTGHEYARDSRIILRAMNDGESDRNDYLKLYYETNVNLPEDNEFKEIIWNMAINSNELHLFIIDIKTEAFVGILSLKRLEQEKKELGIDILLRFQRKGYGYEAIKLFLEYIKFQESELLVRIQRDNISSKALFTKLGVEWIGEEPFGAPIMEMIKNKDTELFKEIEEDSLFEGCGAVDCYMLKCL